MTGRTLAIACGIALALLQLLMLQCGPVSAPEDAGNPDDAEIDAGADAGPDSSDQPDRLDPSDAGQDSGFDAGRDAGPKDAGFDSGHDAGFDSGFDAGWDAGKDGGPSCDGGIKTCSSSNCPSGCCDGCGNCRTGNEHSACGQDGLKCADCPATPNKVCYLKTCFPCTGTSCAGGCCSKTNECHEGSEDGFCGTGGATCLNCPPGGAHCVKKACVVCDLSSCGSGCCDADGWCRTGTESSACGMGSERCTDCTQLSTKICHNRNCSACNTTTCAGCCLAGLCTPGQYCFDPATNSCADGNNDMHCGYGGTCVNCWNMGYYCYFGYCQ
jgi:hypothetical protein